MNKKQLSARAKKAWVTRRLGQATPVLTVDGEFFLKKIKRHLAAVKAWKTRRGE